MENIPNTIWLQYHGDQKPEPDEVVSVQDVTWSASKEFRWDIGPYVLSSELERENTRLREALKECRELLGESEREEINIRDEIEKWDRAFSHLLPSNTERR